jgi:hypothetical protein
MVVANLDQMTSHQEVCVVAVGGGTRQFEVALPDQATTCAVQRSWRRKNLGIWDFDAPRCSLWRNSLEMSKQFPVRKVAAIRARSTSHWVVCSPQSTWCGMKKDEGQEVVSVVMLKCLLSWLFFALYLPVKL